MKKIILTTVFCTVLLAASAHAETTTCRPFVEGNIAKVMQVFHNIGSSEVEKRQQLNAVFAQAVDTDWIGKTALGNVFQTASEVEKQQFLGTYRKYLADIYISKFKDEDGMSVDNIAIVSVDVNPDATTGKILAQTLIQNKGDDDAHVNFVLDDAAGCKVHDIVVNGVSMLVGQRSQMASVSAGGMSAVLAALAKHKTAE